MKVVFASSNRGKIRELETLLKDFHFTLIPQSQLGVSDAEETGLTFVENALIKARHACKETGLPAIADDSGLAVAALQGAPGIYSARYAGANADTTTNINKLLFSMKNIPETQRQAAFHCILVYMLHADDPTPLISHGVWHGNILQQTQGQGGFGYDPVFFVSSENKSAAELPDTVKNRLSHRGQALRKLIQLISNERNLSC